MQKLKWYFKGISWPTKKDVLIDTAITVSVTTVLSVLIMGWSSLIEFVVSWISTLLH